jgi:hypothetical protein
MAGAAFAQEVKISGLIETGLLFSKQGDEDMTVKPNNDHRGVPLRAQLQGDVSFGNYGARVRLRTNDGYNVFVHQAYVFGNLFENLLTFSGGKLAGVWATDGSFDNSYDGVSGVRLELKPIEGLSVGFALDGGSVIEASGSQTLGQFFQETVIGGKYKTDLFSVALALKLDSDGDDLIDDLKKPIYDTSSPPTIIGFEKKGLSEYTKLLYSFKIAPGAFSFVADGQFFHLGNDDEKVGIEFEAYQDIGYQVSDPFEVHLALEEKGAFGEDKDTHIQFAPGVKYGITEATTLKGDIGFNIATREKSDITVWLKPGVEYLFGSNASLGAWYKLYLNPDNVKDSDPKHEIQIEIAWTF